MVGTAAFLMLIIFFAIAFKVLAEDIHSSRSGIVIIAGSLWGIFMLPMMLIFTVKNQQKIRVDVQPPRQLQFHDAGMKV